MLDEMQKDGELRMGKSLDALRQAFMKIRTGRAHPSLLEGVTVACYGAKTPLKQVANITVQDGRTLVISPWDMSLLKDIEKALLRSDIGITPTTSGDMIRMPLPPLTEENRKDLGKTARQAAEQARVAIRNVRRDILSKLKNKAKEKEIGTDDEKHGQSRIQKITDWHVAEADRLLADKEADLLDVGT